MDGQINWYLKDQTHREDGPAVIWPDGRKEYWLNGKRVTETDVMGYIIVEDGKEIKLSGESYYRGFFCSDC